MAFDSVPIYLGKDYEKKKQEIRDEAAKRNFKSVSSFLWHCYEYTIKHEKRPKAERG